MRIKALTMNGHPVDKIEMILIGGTFNFYKKSYQLWFVCESFRACNNYLAKEEGREYIEFKSEEECDLKYLEYLQTLNQKAHARIIGLSIETRPDYINDTELKYLRVLGVTKVEIGVQHLNQKVLDFNKREMSISDIKKGSELLRDYGFKIVYHMMPNLPMSDPQMDVKMFSDLYSGLYHHPDMLKIYPCMVVRGSLLYKLVTQSKIKYEAYDDNLLTQVLADAEKYVPNYTRLIRVIRDIPADYIIVGSKKSNLREDVDAYQKKRKVPQVDIRAREIRDSSININDFELTDTVYNTYNGEEHFLQFENKKNEIGENNIAGFLRLRLKNTNNIKNIFKIIKNKIINLYNFLQNKIQNTNTHKNWGLDKWQKESAEYNQKYLSAVSDDIDNLLCDAALVRELHVYGTMKKVGEAGTQSQHTGMGKKLLLRAESVARDRGYKKLVIISGVGVRDYYEKRGYVLRATYMVKYL
jgi:elongator complex protein 3